MTKNSHFEIPISTQTNAKTSIGKSQQLEGKTHPIKQPGVPLRNQLLLAVLPLVLTPLITGGIIVGKIQHHNAEVQIKSKLQEQAMLAGKLAKGLLEEELKLPAMVATNPLVINAARRGSQKVEASNLQQVSIEQVEESFSATKLLQPNQDLNDYLRRTANISQVTQLSFTEKYGFNVAYTTAPHDFVQRDEQWWQEGKNKHWWVSTPDFDPSIRLFSITLVKAIADPQSGEFLGVVKSVLPASQFDRIALYLQQIKIQGSQIVQLVDSSTGRVIATATAEGASSTRKVKGSEAVIAVSAALVKAFQEPKLNLEQVMSELKKQYSLQNLTFKRFNELTSENNPSAEFLYQNRYYTLTTLPRINWVAVASMDNGEVISTNNELISVFALTGLVFSLGAIVILFRLAHQISTPLVNLASIFKQVRTGNLDVVAQPVGNRETQTLARSLNNLVSKVKSLMQQTNKQNVRQKEALKLIIETAIKVNSSISQNKGATCQLADQVIQQTNQITQMLNSVEEIGCSIKEVAKKTKVAAQVAHTASATAATSKETIAQTVEHLYQLRLTVAATVKKVKQLGELSQEIVQAIAPINQMSMQTNVLAINTNLEAAKIEAQPGCLESVSAEVVALAERLATVKAEIEQIVDNIQWKTSEVMEAMEQEISQIVSGTNSVEITQQDCQQILAVAQKLEALVQSIADDTITQTQTSRSLAQLKEEMIPVAERTTDFSIKVSSAWQETFGLARQLQVSIETLKVGDKT